MTDQPYTGPEVDAAVRILREDAQAARDRKLMERLDAMEDRLGRMPVKEMTPEEKAAEYDRLMAAQGTGGSGGGRPPAAGKGTGTGKAPDEGDPGTGAPPPPAPKAPTPPADTTTRKAWWDGYQAQGS